MIRYSLAAFSLKMFSLNDLTKKIYRGTANIVGARKRKRSDFSIYMKRGNLLVDLCKKYKILEEGNDALEIGTGWMHWFSVYLRLYNKIKITTFDIWDNRQFDALMAALTEIIRNPRDDAIIIENIEALSQIDSFNKLYEKLDLKYVIKEDGSIKHFADNYFSLVFSFHVLEHVYQKNINGLIKQIYRKLKPGGYSIHQIGIDDHLSHYDQNESPKKYLCYSNRAWKMFFENEVQYFNRVQADKWLEYFIENGFVLIKQISEHQDLNLKKINLMYQNCSKSDLSCTILTIVHQKPME